MKILMFDAKPYDGKFFDEANKNYEYHITYTKDRLSPNTTGMVSDYDVVCAFVNDDLSTDVVRQLHENGIKLIALRCAGHNNVDTKLASELMSVVNVPFYSPYAVAEHTIALLLNLNRKIHKSYNRTREGNFSLNGLLGFDLHGKTIGIIGYGRIGRAVASIARGFGMNIVFHDAFQVPSSENVSLDELYHKSDIISMHCPLTQETHHMINHESISKMKDNVIFINTSRGGLVNTHDLITAIKTNKMGSVALDVYENEVGYFFEDHSCNVLSDDQLCQLLSYSNVLITAHQGFFTETALSNIASTTLKNIQEFFAGNFENVFFVK